MVPRCRESGKTATGQAPARSTRTRYRPARPPKGKGPALLPAPPAPSEGSAGVRRLDGPKATRPAILAHPLRLPLPLLPIPIPGICIPGTGSAAASPALLGTTPPASCCALRLSEERVWSRIAQETDASSGASYRLAFEVEAELLPQRLPAEIGSSAPSSPLGCPAEGDWDARPDHPRTMTRHAESSKRKLQHQPCG